MNITLDKRFEKAIQLELEKRLQIFRSDHLFEKIGLLPLDFKLVIENVDELNLVLKNENIQCFLNSIYLRIDENSPLNFHYRIGFVNEEDVAKNPAENKQLLTDIIKRNLILLLDKNRVKTKIYLNTFDLDFLTSKKKEKIETLEKLLFYHAPGYDLEIVDVVLKSYDLHKVCNVVESILIDLTLEYKNKKFNLELKWMINEQDINFKLVYENSILSEDLICNILLDKLI